MSFSVFYQTPIEDIIDQIVMFYLPKGGLIYDPTCGQRQRQLGKLLNGKLDIDYRIIKSDIQPGYGDFVASVDNIPLPDNHADMIIYDPPFVPHARKEQEIEDKRGHDYGLKQRTVDDVLGFYSQKILDELKRVTRQWLVIRGEDFYFPSTSTNLYLYHDFCIENLEKAGLKVRANYTNRFFNPMASLYRARLKNYQRPIITHSYITVAEK